MEQFNFITIRLGKDSIPAIQNICSSATGVLNNPFTISVKCTQIPENYRKGDYAFLWLGSDNNKGMPTQWKQGFKAIGRVLKVIRGEKYNDTSDTNIEIVYIFDEAINRVDILRCAPIAYYWCSSLPLIGLDDHANQTIRSLSGNSFADLRAFFSAIEAVTHHFKDDITQIEPRFETFFGLLLPNPQLYPNTNNLYEINTTKQAAKKTNSLQQIFYGAPGTGKSHIINEITEGESVIRTTFHPDSDYSTFVGAYKPTTKEVTLRDLSGHPVKENGVTLKEDRIIYEFVDQAFLQAYVQAWKYYEKADDSSEPQNQYLIIEEINRGNCAQIFGDLFQLLDRNSIGFSDYPINADNDMKKQLSKAFAGLSIAQADKINACYKGKDVTSKVLSGEILLLPNNLYIWATMNTSDQSLFPIDSAFKRRWDWKYVPIDYDKETWSIVTKDEQYSWSDFLKKINNLVASTTKSEDKMLGFYFAKAKNGIIDADTFVGKVVFYLWNDVFKDYGLPKEILNGAESKEFAFRNFFIVDGHANEDIVKRLLDNLGVAKTTDANLPAEDTENQDEA